MIILLFGVSNVGKTTTGRIIAKKLGYSFYDLDDEIKAYYHVTLDQFMKQYKELEDRDRNRAKLLQQLLKNKDNLVVAVTPITYLKYYHNILHRKNVFSLVLTDTAENIFDRLIFTDENDEVFEDCEVYRNAHRDYYIHDIKEDLRYYGNVYACIQHIVDVNGRTQEEVADSIIREYLS